MLTSAWLYRAIDAGEGPRALAVRPVLRWVGVNVLVADVCFHSRTVAGYATRFRGPSWLTPGFVPPASRSAHVEGGTDGKCEIRSKGVCHLCGSGDHAGEHCPERRCLRCGSASHTTPRGSRTQQDAVDGHLRGMRSQKEKQQAGWQQQQPACVDARLAAAVECWVCGGRHGSMSCFGREMQRLCANCGSQQHVAYECHKRGMSAAVQLFTQAGGNKDQARVPGQVRPVFGWEGRSATDTVCSSQGRARSRSMPGRRRF